MTTAFTGNNRPPVNEDAALPAQSAYTVNKVLVSAQGTHAWTTILATIGTSGGKATPGECTSVLLNDQATNAGRMLSTNGASITWLDTIPSPLYTEYDISNFTNGVVLSSETIVRTLFVRSVQFPINFVGSLAFCNNPAIYNAVFSIRKNGAQVGTMTFAADVQSASFSLPTATTFNPGDMLEIVGPATADYQLSNLATTLIGTLLNAPVTPSTAFWINLFGNGGMDVGSGIVIDTSGSAYVVGYTNSAGFGGDDAFIAKFDTYGDIQWQRAFGSVNTDQAVAIAIDGSNNAYVVGSTTGGGSGGSDIMLLKFDPTGNLLWQRAFGGSNTEYGYAVATDVDGNVYVVGSTVSQGAGSGDAIIAKYNSGGVLWWQVAFGGVAADGAVGIVADSQGNAIISGFTSSVGSGNSDQYIIKVSASGAIQWQRCFGSSGADRAYGITVDHHNSVYMVGRTASQGAGDTDIVVVKYDHQGIIQWQRALGGTSADAGYNIYADIFDCVYVVGTTASDGDAGGDIVVVKYNEDGHMQWQRLITGTSADSGAGIVVDQYGSMFLVGSTSSQGHGGSDAFIAKLPSDGSKVGTYGNFIYRAATLTPTNTTLVDTKQTLVPSVTTLVNTATTVSSTATALSATKIVV